MFNQQNHLQIPYNINKTRVILVDRFTENGKGKAGRIIMLVYKYGVIVA